MGKRKTNKEYAIRLTHPELGVWYFNYHKSGYSNGYGRADDYLFTTDISKVNTWKSLKYAEKITSTIKVNLDQKRCKILLSYGNKVDLSKLSPISFNNDLKEATYRIDSNDELIKMQVSRKRYYFPITSVTSGPQIKVAKEIIDRLNHTLVQDSELITQHIKEHKQIEKNFMDCIKNFERDLHIYRKEQKILDKDDGSAFLDIVDASYGFRLLKLKNLRLVQDEEIEMIE